MDNLQTIFSDADIVIFVTEVNKQSLNDERFFKKLINSKKPTLVLINKIDLSTQETVVKRINYWNDTIPENIGVIPISASEKFNLDSIIEIILTHLPESPAYFDKTSFTTKNERFIVEEKIREKILLNYNKEIPYSVEVKTEEFKESETIIKIRLIIYTERDSQKQILIGKNGRQLKKIGTQSRKDLEMFFNKKVYLELYTKVDDNWRNNKQKLKNLGYF